MQVLQINDRLKQENANILDSFHLMIDTMKLRSVNTAINYESWIRTFFMDTRSKKLEDLSYTDLKFNKADIKRYQIEMFNKKLKSSTISTRLSAMKKLYIALEDDGIPVNANIFDIEIINKKDTQKYDSLSVEEVIDIVDYVSTKRNGDQKSLLIELAFSTSFRLKSLLTLTKKSFYIQNNLYLVKVIGKGNKPDIKQIDHDLYYKALSISDEEKIFTLGERSIVRMMEEIRNHFDFGNRNIVFHSLKKAGIEYRGELTGFNVKAMQRQGNHSNASTTLNNYVKDYDIEELIPIDIHSTIDTSIIEDVSHNQLLQVIKELDMKTQRLIAQKLQLI